MYRYTLFLLMVFSFPGTGQEKPHLPLMPYPASVEQQPGYLKVEAPLYIDVQSLPTEFRISILDIFESMNVNITQTQSSGSAHNVSIQIRQPVSTAIVPTLDNDESYSLTVTENSINITAEQIWGALHGLQTLRQLYDVEEQGFPLVSIKDQPRFPWRGLLIDSVRHFIPVDVIKRQIAGMASAKLNVFHWHLTDDQGWRLPIDGYEKLHEDASDGLFYSHQQIQDVVQFAARHGIRVIPEVDFPGHASAIALAYPDLMSGPSAKTMQRHWGVFPPLLDPSNPNVYVFVDKVFQQLNTLFPDQYVHIGGDEVNPSHWQQNPQIQAFMAENQLSDAEDLHSYFNKRMQHMLAEHGKHMIGWDEILHPDLDKHVVVQSWRGLDNLKNIIKGGFKGLLSNGFYIDQAQYAAYHYRNDPEGKLAPQAPGPFAKNMGWTRFDLNMPRLKGAAVEITIWLANNQDVALVQLNDQPPRWARQINRVNDMAQINIDAWMGPFNLTVTGTKNDGWRAQAMVGNAPYPLLVSGVEQELRLEQVHALFPVNNLPQEGQILGGEATIWSELVDQHNLDRRIWPRLYAIAERLWSPVSINDPLDMYRRLWQMDRFSEQVVGLKHNEQMVSGLGKLVAPSVLPALLELIETLEPAHYYTRHHIHYQQDRYHQLSPLNNLVDYLPSQSQAMQHLDRNIASLANEETFTVVKQQILTKLRAYLAAARAVQQQPPKSLQPGLTDMIYSIQSAIKVMQACQQIDQQRLQLSPVSHHQPQEIILALGLRINQLHQVCH